MKYTRKRQLLFLEQFKTDKKVVDIGSGLNPPYKNLFPNRIRVDVDPLKCPEVLGSIYQLPFESGSQEVILCSEVFEHLDRPEEAADELHRVLGNGGVVIFTTRFIFPIHGAPNDYYRYTEYSLAKIFSKFSIEKITFESGPFYTVGVILQRIAFQTELKGGRMVKFGVCVIAWFFTRIDWLVKKEFGDIGKQKESKGVFSTGIYLHLKK